MKITAQAYFFIASIATPAVAFGAGFSLNEQSARTLAQAFAGRVSDADNASTLASNPAGMSFLEQAEVSAGFSFIDAHSDISHAISTTAGLDVRGSNDGDMIPFSTVPFGYYVQPLNDHWAAGIGIYAPFGLTTDYESEFQGRYFGTRSDIQAVTLQPSISYKFDNGLALGLGITYNRFDGELQKKIFIAPTLDDINAKVSGDDAAWGYNIGVLYQLNEYTRVGLTYYSKVDYTLKGRTSLSNLPAILGGSSVRYGASLDIETPDRIDVGITHKLTPKLTLHADISRTDWSTLEEIRVENHGAPAALAESVEPLDWKAAMFYSVGLSYQIDPQWRIRGGIGYDEQPIPDSTRSVRLPAGDRTLFGIGATWTPLQNLDVDAAFMYIQEETVRVDQQESALITGLPVGYDAKYSTSVNLLSLQASWKF